MKLTANAVAEILSDCLYTDEEIPNGEPPEDAVLVEGVLSNFGLHPGRLETHKAEIAELLAQLPTNFQPLPDGGGGWSFLNACMTEGGVQWGEHRDIERLVVLGIATEQASFSMPRDMWSILPGSLPYFGVKIRDQK